MSTNKIVANALAAVNADIPVGTICTIIDTPIRYGGERGQIVGKVGYRYLVKLIDRKDKTIVELFHNQLDVKNSVANALVRNAKFKVGDKVRVAGIGSAVIKTVDVIESVVGPRVKYGIDIGGGRIMTIPEKDVVKNAMSHDFALDGVYSAAKKMVQAGAKHIRNYLWEIPEDMLHGADVIVRKAGGKVKVVGDANRDGFVIAEVTDPLAQALERKGVKNAVTRNAWTSDEKRDLGGVKFGNEGRSRIGRDTAEFSRPMLGSYFVKRNDDGGMTVYFNPTNPYEKGWMKKASTITELKKIMGAWN